jgi:hypothetical protein
MRQFLLMTVIALSVVGSVAPVFAQGGGGAGGGEVIGDREALDLADGCPVHLDTFGCVIAYGARWRCAATEALAAMGSQPPADDGGTEP